MASTETIYTFTAKLKDLDALNAKLQQAKLNLKGLKKETKSYAAISTEIGALTKQVNNNKASLERLNGGAKKLNATGNKMVSIFRSASIAIVSAFAFRAIIGGFRGVIKTFSDFEAQMSAVKAISGATNEEFNKLQSSARKLGASTVFTAKQVAELQEQYARLGFTAEEIISAQGGTIALAAATGESLASSAETSGSILRAFGLEAEQTGNVVDVMGAAFTSSALNLERFSQSMKFVAPIAREAGFTMEETSAQLAILSNNGLSGSLAGNALKNIFLRLGDANSKLNKRLGRTVQGLPDMIDALRQMKDESFGLTEATELLDKRSAPAFLTLINNIDGLEDSLDTLNNAEGAVSRMAAIRLDNLQGDFTLLNSASEGLGVAIGEVFNGSLRDSIAFLTQFLQGLSENKTALNTIRNVFMGVLDTITLYGLALIVLKTNTLLTSAATGKLSFNTKKLLVALRAARTGTLTLSTAMQGLKAAIASTGVGLLVVGLTSLYNMLTQVDEATEAVNRKFNRMSESFENDIENVVSHNINSQERLDLLRKLKQEYPELTNEIDLEIASNEQLLSILDLVNSTRAEREQIELANVEIDKLSKDLKEDVRDLNRDILEAEKKISDGNLQGRYLKQQEKIILNKNKKIKQLTEEFRIEEKAILKTTEFYIQSIKDKEKGNKAFNELSLKEQGTYRSNLRDFYLDELEDYRDLKRKKQLIAIEERETEIEEIKQIIDFRRLQDATQEGTLAERTKAQKELDALGVVMGARLVKRANESADANSKLGIKLQELQRFVTKLNAALKAQGPATKGTVFDAGNLRKTKDRIKDLIKLRAEGVVNVDESERAKVEAAKDAQLEKLRVERAGIIANIKDISDAQKILESGDEKSIAAFIKKNRNKFESLKNLSNQEYQKLIDIDKSYYDGRSTALQAMLDEEGEKFGTNTNLVEAQQNKSNKLLEQLRVADKLADRENEKEKSANKLEQDTKTIKGLFINSKIRLNNIDAELEKDKALNTEAFTSGLIDEAEYNKNIIDLEKAAEDERQSLRERRLEKTVEMYGQLSALALNFAQNRADVEMQKINEQFDQEKQDRQNKFDAELEMAEAAGGDTEAMKRAFDNQEIANERIKQEQLTIIKKRMFRLNKANDIIQATLNGFLAITRVTAETGLAAIAAAPIMSAFVAAQIAGIASQKFVGEKGGIVPGGIEEFGTGGMVSGPRHAQGGVKFAVGGTVAELEGGEAVINRRSTAMYKDQLSAMNVAGGGKKFEQGGVTPSNSAAQKAVAGLLSNQDMVSAITGAINTQKVIVSEAEISSSQNNVQVSESLSTIF